MLFQVFVFLAPIYTPTCTERPDAQALVEYEKTTAPRIINQNRGLSCNRIWIPTFVV